MKNTGWICQRSAEEMARDQTAYLERQRRSPWLTTTAMDHNVGELIFGVLIKYLLDLFARISVRKTKGE